jgi:hypothetical protein
VKFKAAFDGMRHGHENQRHNHYGQKNVGYEHAVVEGAPESFAAEGGMHAAHENLVQHIGNEEDARDAKCSNHAIAMGDFSFALDEQESCGEEDGGNRVQSRIECRQVGNAHGTLFERSSFRQVSAM